MESLNNIITICNDYLWSYILIVALLFCAIYFSIRLRFVQFKMLKEMISLLTESAGGAEGKHISSFQAFSVSLASRVGTGNLAGVATAIAVGGPGAVFWMWIIALLGASSAFVESTLAQLYKRKENGTFIGGPAYYMERGLNKRWLAVVFAVLITLTFGFAFNSVQSNTISQAFSETFQMPPVYMGILLSILTLLIIFGGIKKIAQISSFLVPFMAIGYILLALGILIINAKDIPYLINIILSNAFGWEEAVGGGMGAALMQGIKRGLFSNEAGMGSAPNAAATAHISHPVKQGLIQSLGVFVDTLLICTCTAFIILLSDAPLDGSVNGIQLTQNALTSEVGEAGNIFIAIAIFLFAFSSILGNYYYGESNIRFITKRKSVMTAYRLCVGGVVMLGALASLDTVWNFADIMMGLMCLCNLFAIVQLSGQASNLLKDYIKQKKQGISSPIFNKTTMKNEANNIDSW